MKTHIPVAILIRVSTSRQETARQPRRPDDFAWTTGDLPSTAIVARRIKTARAPSAHLYPNPADATKQ